MPLPLSPVKKRKGRIPSCNCEMPKCKTCRARRRKSKQREQQKLLLVHEFEKA